MNDKRKAIFFWSDLHIGHENSIVFDKRPFENLDHMHRVLVNNYNSTVPEDGLCYFLGDVGLGNKQITKTVIQKMHGTKVLILGNHDGGVNAMYDMGFDVVLYNATLWIANKEVTLSHCPLRGVFREDTSNMKNASPGENWHGENRHTKFSVDNHGQFHCHGHCHSGPHNNKLVIDGKQWDVGVCGNNYTPISISRIESWISKYGR